MKITTVGIDLADATSFDSGRQVSAWLSLVPRQSSSGGKPTLLGMSKRGDAYLRTLLIHGARSAILTAENRVDNTQGWLTNLLKRRHPNIAAVALANKNVRTVWAILAHGREFKADYVPTRMAAYFASVTDDDGNTGEHTTDCSGDHAVKAKQVRPWLVKPRTAAALRVRVSYRDPISKTHQGQRRKPQLKSECTGAI
jgi:transposase